MRWILPFLVVILAMGFGGAQPAWSQEAPGSYIVVLEESITPEAVPSVAQELSQRHGLALGHVYNVALKGFSAQIPASRLGVLRADFRINNIVEDRVVTAFCHTGPQQLPTGVERVHTKDSPTANINNGAGGSSGQPNNVNADIAILDTGIYGKHADLYVFKGVDCTKSGCPTVTPKDPHGHGTHVAGTAAAIDNTRYVVGVAPGARLWSVRVLNNQGMGFTSWVIAGIDYVTANKDAIEVANMSLGGPGSDTGNCGMNGSTVVDPFHKAICNSVGKGVVYTVAAGNDSENAANTTPAAYDEVITVSALADSNGQPGGGGPATSYGADDTFATFSNFGADVDLIAPGVDITSTFPGDKANPGGYCAVMSGTSMASPHVAGGVALYLATHSKPIGKDGVVAVRDALRAAGKCPNGTTFGNTGCAAGSVWTGDPDGITEPLLNVAGF